MSENTFKSKIIDGKTHFPCDFCDKYSNEVTALIKGPSVAICDECVDTCVLIVKEEKGKKYLQFLRET